MQCSSAKLNSFIGTVCCSSKNLDSVGQGHPGVGLEAERQRRRRSERRRRRPTLREVGATQKLRRHVSRGRQERPHLTHLLRQSYSQRSPKHATTLPYFVLIVQNYCTTPELRQSYKTLQACKLYRFPEIGFASSFILPPRPQPPN